MSPSELYRDKPLGLKGLHCFDNMQIGNCFQFRVLGSVEIFLGHHDTFLEKVLIDGDAVLLWHKHSAGEDNNYIVKTPEYTISTFIGQVKQNIQEKHRYYAIYHRKVTY